MRIIPVNVHNILDYIYGVLIIASPWIFNFAKGGAETFVPVAVGILTILMALFTNYKYSAFKIISFNAHLTLDLIIGIFTAASPWIFGFSQYIYFPHLVFGIFAVVVSVMSKRFVNYIAYE